MDRGGDNLRNSDIFEESKVYMPGGVNSPVRAYKGLDIDPPVIASGEGAYLTDEDGKVYTDYVGAWGPMILGHADRDVVEAMIETTKKGIAFGSPTELELRLSRHICQTVDNVDMIRMVNSGTEATMSASRLARGYTGRSKIVKFGGCYHGHFDGFLISAGSGVMTEGIPGSEGVPEEIIRNTLLADYNDIDSVKSLFEKHGEEIAGVIIEPVAGNMGVVPAKQEFLEELDKLCKRHGALLIFDEVMTGFRVAYKGAQSLYGIAPDITTFAKVMGGGLPSGAYGGRRDIMEKLSPLGGVYQAGTMSGNPIVMAAGYATLKKLHENPKIYDHIEFLAEKMESGVLEIAKEKGLPVVVNRFKSMMTIFYNQGGKVESYEDAKASDTELYSKVFKHMTERGVYMSPSQFEAMFFSAAHTESDIDRFLEALRAF